MENSLAPGHFKKIIDLDCYVLGYSKGDIAIIDSAEGVRNNCLVVAGYEGAYGVYRYSHGEIFPPHYSRNELDDVIIGVVVEIERKNA